jgi:hypothetical protein
MAGWWAVVRRVGAQRLDHPGGGWAMATLTAREARDVAGLQVAVYPGCQNAPGGFLCGASRRRPRFAIDWHLACVQARCRRTRRLRPDWLRHPREPAKAAPRGWRECLTTPRSVAPRCVTDELERARSAGLAPPAAGCFWHPLDGSGPVRATG